MTKIPQGKLVVEGVCFLSLPQSIEYVFALSVYFLVPFVEYRLRTLSPPKTVHSPIWNLQLAVAF